MKKTMKFALMLMLVAALLLAGCSGNDPQNVAGTVDPVKDATEADVGGTVETAAPAQETNAPEQTPTGAAEDESQISLGRLEGGVYTNAYAGYGCELDASWTFYSAEELQVLPEDVAELFENSELLDSDELLNQITDMMAENVNDLTTMNVLYQKMSLQERVAYAVMDDDTFLDVTLEQKDAMIDAYAQAGILVEDMEKVPVTFLGRERVALHTASTMQEVPYYTLQIFDYDRGQYAVTLTLASYVEDRTMELLNLFYAVE